MDESLQRHLEQRNETADVLRRAKAMIDRPEKWCQGALLNDGGAMCMLGAINMAVSGDADLFGGQDAKMALYAAVGNHPTSVWNNAPERTHAEVMAAFDKAIALAESSGE